MNTGRMLNTISGYNEIDKTTETECLKNSQWEYKIHNHVGSLIQQFLCFFFNKHKNLKRNQIVALGFSMYCAGSLVKQLVLTTDKATPLVLAWFK